MNPDKPIAHTKMLIAAIALFAVALAIRLIALGAADLSEDEEMSMDLPQVTFGELFTSIGSRPPMAYAAQKVFVTIAGGASPFIVRLASVLEGALAVAMALFLGNRLAGPRVGLLMAATLALSHFHFVWSRDSRYYPMLCLMSILFLYSYWRAFGEGRWRWLSAVGLSGLGLAWSHQTGYLMLLASALCLPLFLLRREFLQHLTRRRALTFAVPALCSVAVLAVLLRRPIHSMLRVIVESMHAEIRTLNFDIRPDFLAHRLGEALGVGETAGWFAAALLLTGLVCYARKQWRGAVLLLSILVVPFAAVWVLKPPFTWNPKYFIFMLPISLFLLAYALDSVSGLVLKGRFRAVVLVGAALLFAIPNGMAIRDTLRYPKTAHQRLAADFRSWIQEGEKIGYTFPGRARVFRHYFNWEKVGAEMTRVGDEEGSAETPELPVEDVPHSWFLHLGSTYASEPMTVLILSHRLSRTPYHHLFVAHGPNIQRIDFGETYPGTPNASGDSVLDPGMSTEISLLIPRDGTRRILVETIPSGRGNDCALSWNGTPLTPELIRPNTPGIVYTLARGRGVLEMKNTSTTPVTIESLSMLDVFDGGDLLIPAWDFNTVVGSELSSLYLREQRGEMWVRNLRRGQTFLYRFVSDVEGAVRIALTALSDPPFSNRYTVELVGTGMTPVTLDFDRLDGKTVTLRTLPVFLRRGIYDITVRYEGLTEEQRLDSTQDYTIQTAERAQTPGFFSIALEGIKSAGD